jgi:hypothetical protein
MTVHSFHIFDRKGKTIFTKRYVKSSKDEKDDDMNDLDNEQLSEQRKLVFGMIFSLRELSSSLCPKENGGPSDLHLVKTGASAWYNYETVSGLRFVLYTTADTSVGVLSSSTSSGAGTSTTTTTGGGGTSNFGSGGVSTGPSNSSGHGGPSAAPLSGGGIIDGDITSTTTTTVSTTTNSSMMTSPVVTANIRAALKHIYEQIWVSVVVRSPMYQPLDPDIRSTNFETALDGYLRTMPWFR